MEILQEIRKLNPDDYFAVHNGHLYTTAKANKIKLPNGWHLNTAGYIKRDKKTTGMIGLMTVAEDNFERMAEALFVEMIPKDKVEYVRNAILYPHRASITSEGIYGVKMRQTQTYERLEREIANMQTGDIKTFYTLSGNSYTVQRRKGKPWLIKNNGTGDIMEEKLGITDHNQLVFGENTGSYSSNVYRVSDGGEIRQKTFGETIMELNPNAGDIFYDKIDDILFTTQATLNVPSGTTARGQTITQAESERMAFLITQGITKDIHSAWQKVKEENKNKFSQTVKGNKPFGNR